MVARAVVLRAKMILLLGGTGRRRSLGTLAAQTATLVGPARGAGFSDHAHFTRSFVRLLGRTPSSMHGELALLGRYC